MTVTLHQGDIPADLSFGDVVAVDTEMMGLRTHRDRLCLVQLSSGDGNAHIVQLKKGEYAAPNLKRLMTDPKVTKLFHFARSDVASIWAWLGVICAPVYCTKLASRLARTYTQHHSLKTVCAELLGVELDKQQQATNWGADTLTPEQIAYAASDVYHLHAIKAKLDALLAQEGRAALADECFRFLPVRALLDVAGWDDEDIFAH